MSIRQVQTKNILEFVAQQLFADGVNPTSRQIMNFINLFFTENTVGLPLQVKRNLFIEQGKSDEELFNDFMAVMIVNMDTLYETCANHVEEIMNLNTVLRTHLDRLKVKRRVLEQRVDDYLLGIFNSDGYFYSFSDGFANTDNTDFLYTSAFVDTTATTVSLPSVSSQSKVVSGDKLQNSGITVKDANGGNLSIKTKGGFDNALDGMTNTAWSFEVRTNTVGPVVADIEIQVSTALGDSKITKIDLLPFGVTPIQCAINADMRYGFKPNATVPFSYSVQTSADRMSFISEQTDGDVDRIKLQLTKHAPDYIEKTATSQTNVYIFGFREILMTEQYFDSTSTFVSQPISLANEIVDASTIDAVSLVVEDFVPVNTSIAYYVAMDNPNATNLEDFDWQPINPIRSRDIVNSGSVVSFNGSFGVSNIVRKKPRYNSELKLIDFDSTNQDLTQRNPTPSYFPGIDTYRLFKFDDEFLDGTLKLEEGINTTRIFYTERSEDAMTNGFTFWNTKFNTKNSYFTSYGTIDSGHDFFYGADVGEDNKSVYIETFINTDKEYPVFLKECNKSDFNSKTWHIRIFINGKEIANMPVGTDRLTVPWKLKEGKNHIVVMANIPAATQANPSPYIGTFNLMVDGKLTDFGSVKLDDWTYVDLFKFQNNQVNDPNAFTIYNKELISRRKPTDNFRISFKKKTNTSPEALRFRADFARSTQYANSTALLDSYRIRFAYL